MLGLLGDIFDKDIIIIKVFIEMKLDICRIYLLLVIKDIFME